MNKNKKQLISARQKCVDAKVGDEIVCPSCNSKHIKSSYQTVFCKTKGGTVCKDNFWNNVDPKKRNNMTRISPANAAFKETRISHYTSEGYKVIDGVAYDEFDDPMYDVDPDDDTHPFDFGN